MEKCLPNQKVQTPGEHCVCVYTIEELMCLHSTGQKRGLLGRPLPLIHLPPWDHLTIVTPSQQPTSAIAAITDIPTSETLTTHTALDHFCIIYILPTLLSCARGRGRWPITEFLISAHTQKQRCVLIRTSAIIYGTVFLRTAGAADRGYATRQLVW